MRICEMEKALPRYCAALQMEELADATIDKYRRDILFFLRQNGGKAAIDKADVIAYKQALLSRYKANTVNAYLISLNRYLRWLKQGDLTVKTIRIQQRGHLENVVSMEEYRRLLQYCQRQGYCRDYALLHTLAATGIRVGELRYITRESAERGACEIYNKRKSRLILLPCDLSQILLDYCDQRGISGGVIFVGRTPGAALQPKSVWKLLKALARAVGIDPCKIYPHSFRHLFAKTYMEKIGNLMELADLMGHSNLETTRIYAMSSLEEKRRSLDALGL